MKCKRIGTLTAGVTLIVVGILFFILSFFPNYKMLILMLKFWPLILISLGFEMLSVRFNRSNAEGVKFDFASVIMMFISIGFAVCCGVAYQFLPFIHGGIIPLH